MQDYATILLILAIILLLALLLALYLFSTKVAKTKNALQRAQEDHQHSQELHNQELQYHRETLTEKESEISELSQQLEQIEGLYAQLQVASAATQSRLGALEEQMEAVLARNRQLETSNEQLAESRTRTDSENRHLRERMVEFQQEQETLRQQMRNEFKVLAEEITRKTSNDLHHRSKEGLDQLLNPFKEKLDGLRQKVEDTYTQDKAERISLKEQIKELTHMNEKLSHEADNLVNALKGSNKTQGNWGEMILESILEHSGLIKGQHYEREVTLRDDEGNALLQDGKRMRPDVIVRYPDGRSIIIDSKVSLIAYTEFSEASEPEMQQKALDRHVLSLKNHIQGLSNKRYEQYVQAPDFVLMFVPIEPAFHFALQHDQSLWEYAWERKIILIGPTTLIATLRLVSEVWSRDKQSRNAMDIAERAGALYDKFVLFYDSLGDIGKHLDKAQNALGESKNRLRDGRGSVLRNVEMLKELGAKTKKSLPSGEDLE